jgi:hypothetical protein
MIKGVTLDFKKAESDVSMTSEIKFTAMSPDHWPHDKAGVKGVLKVSSPTVSLARGERLYLPEFRADEEQGSTRQTPAAKVGQKVQDAAEKGKSIRSHRKSRQLLPDEPGPASLPIVRIFSRAELEFEMEVDLKGLDKAFAQRTLTEVRRQIFYLSRFVCGTYIDSQLSENGLPLDVARTMAVHTFTCAQFFCPRIKRTISVGLFASEHD